jgi:tetratricopeptide (TPR) repeat protein
MTMCATKCVGFYAMRVAAFAVLPLAMGVVGAQAFAQESELDALRAAVKTAPADPANALALGRALRRAGRSVDALAEIRRGVGLGPSSPDLLRQLRWEGARVQFDRRDFAQGLAACKPLEALSVSEGHACAADAQLVRQRATEALDETTAALAKDPQCYEAKVAEGRAYELELDAVRAEASLRQAIAIRPVAMDAHLELGRVLWKAGRGREGITELRKAVELDDNGPDALYALAVAAAPDRDESVHLLQHATRERPSFAEAWMALGTQEFAAGHLAQAVQAGDAVLRVAPTDAGARVLLGKVALSQGRADDAIKQAEAALKVVANSAAAKLLIADGNAKKGEIDAALEAYQAAWGLDHGDPTPLVHASEACHAAGRDTSARAFGARATQEFPKWAPGWVALADALAAQGEMAAARDSYRSALAAPDGLVDKAAVAKKLATLQ